MAIGQMTKIEVHFGQITDKRRAEGKRHKLIEIIGTTFYGVMCGADDRPGIEEYGIGKVKWFVSSVQSHARTSAEFGFRREWILFWPKAGQLFHTAILTFGITIQMNGCIPGQPMQGMNIYQPK